jgi:hypothetical protein
MKKPIIITPDAKLTDKEKIDQMHKAMAQMEKESRSQAIESKIQTYALVIMFVLGVATIADLTSKVQQFTKKL